MSCSKENPRNGLHLGVCWQPVRRPFVVHPQTVNHIWEYWSTSLGNLAQHLWTDTAATGKGTGRIGVLSEDERRGTSMMAVLAWERKGGVGKSTRFCSGCKQKWLPTDESCSIASIFVHQSRPETDAFELWCWRRLLRVPRTARRSNQSVLKDISLEYSLEGLLLKLKLQYFGHLMRRANSLENTLMLGKLKAGGEGDDRGRDGWMASPTRWTWAWASSGRWWRTGKPGVL